MNANPYLIRGTRVPEMFGRKTLLERGFQQLTQPDPLNLSVVGMRLSGKTVFLNALENLVNEKAEDYIAVFRWDFRENTPETDQEFRDELARRIHDSLKKAGADEADYLDDATSKDIIGDISLALDDIWKRKKRILVIFDGFDHVLASDNLTQNLWDNLLHLTKKSGICFITGSRDRLRNLLKHNARRSIFWEQFYQIPITIGKFDESDLDDLFSPLKEREISLNSAAVKEFLHETGGNSVQAIGLLQILYDQAKDGSEIDGEIVKKAGKDTSEKYREILEELWEDFDIDFRNDITMLEEGEVPFKNITEPSYEFLEAQGLAIKSKNKIRSSCRIFYRYASTRTEGVVNIKRLFESEENFNDNIKNLLELRLAQISDGDSDLIDDIHKAVNHLPQNPTDSIYWARTIVIKALELIWKKELDQDGKVIPESWIKEWKSYEDSQYWKPFYDTRKLPKDLGHQCALLDKISGTKYNENAVAGYISKSTYTLVSFINSVSNIGSHRIEVVSLGYASAVCLAAIELCKNLAEELK